MFIVRVLPIMIHSSWCHFQRLVLLDFNSFNDCHICLAKSISLVKRRFFVVARKLWWSILALLFVAIVSSNTEYNFLHSCPISKFDENTNGVKGSCCMFIVILSLRSIVVQNIAWLNTFINMSGRVWVENSYVKKDFLIYSLKSPWCYV